MPRHLTAAYSGEEGGAALHVLPHVGQRQVVLLDLVALRKSFIFNLNHD